MQVNKLQIALVGIFWNVSAMYCLEDKIYFNFTSLKFRTKNLKIG